VPNIDAADDTGRGFWATRGWIAIRAGVLGKVESTGPGRDA
jgi:hypothetical protein